MFKKGDSCFHPDYGNGLILRVNKQNIAKIQFSDPVDPVWIDANHLESPLPDAEAAEYLASLTQQNREKKEHVSDLERKQIRRDAKREKAANTAQPFTVPGLEKAISHSHEPEPIQPAPVLTPVSPVSLRQMPMPAPDLDTFCKRYAQCISAEIYESRNRFKLRKLLIHHAERLQQSAESTVYAIELDSEAFYPEGSDITIWQSRNTQIPLGKAVIASCDGNILLIEANCELPEDLSGMYYSVDEAALLEALNERLDELRENPLSPILSQLILKPRSHIIDAPISPNQMGQNNALNHALNAPITFIWGPPGTGKTETLAKIVIEHLKRGNRILMVSQCNVSVDAAIMRVQQLSASTPQGQCVRYGYPRTPELAENSDVNVSMIALKNNADRFYKRNQLMRELKKTPHISPRYLEIRKELEKLTESLIQEEKLIVKNAHFVATTVSKAVIDRALYKDSFDVVLFDEASMAIVPQIIFAAGLAKSHFICAGDFSQLPPITIASHSALEGDIYLYTGISNAIAQRKSHEWLYMLDTQYRMHPDIADFAGQMMYQGLLKNAPVTSQRAQIAAARPVSGEALVLLNIAGSIITPVDSSKINLMSAFMTFGTALNIVAQSQSVGIIAPYSPQARLMRCMARDLALAEPSMSTLTCSTVHQFQGSEKDVILYDVTETSSASIMLAKTENNYANRLFNVAMTRARGKLCITADRDFVCSNLSPNLMLSALVRRYYHHCVNLRKQFAPAVCSFPYDTMQAYCNDDLIRVLRADIQNVTGSIMSSTNLNITPYLRSAAVFDDIFTRNSKLKLKLNLLVPEPKTFALYAPFFAPDPSRENLIILDKSITWYLYIQDQGVIAGIRFIGKNTARRLQAIYFNAKY